MEIRSVSLTNFKSHRDRHFEFQPGTNAICGANGAGKTSLLEAIAWALFDYADYTKSDLIRKGAASAQVNVQFISSHDGRTYQVQRCTNRGYVIYDPQLQVTLDLKRRKEEILPWLREHLGVPRDTELSELFANTIGIPQGTFTADFLKPGRERKRVFDPILKVEEYKLAFERSNDLRRYAEARVQEREQEIVRYTEQLQDWESLKQDHANLTQAIAQDEAHLQQAQAELATLQAEKDHLTTQAQQLQQLEYQVKTLAAQISAKTQANQLLQANLQQAREAVAICTANREPYQVFQQAEAELQALNQKGKQRQTLLRQREHWLQKGDQGRTQLAGLQQRLELLNTAQVELEQLQPAIQQQQQLEQQETAIAQQLQQLHQKRLEHRNGSQQLSRLQTELAQLTGEIQRLQALEASVQQIPALEQQQERCQSQLSRIEVAKQFEADLRQLLRQGEQQSRQHEAQVLETLNHLREMQWDTPLLAASLDAAVQSLEAGLSLHRELLAELRHILKDWAEQVSVGALKQQLQDLIQHLQTARQQQAELANLKNLLERRASLNQELAAISTQLQQLQQELHAEQPLQQQQTQVTSALRELDNPWGRSQLLAQSLAQRSQVDQQYTRLQQEYAQIQRQLAEFDNQLTAFADLETQIEQQQQCKQRHQEAYHLYIQHRQVANQCRELEAQFDCATTELQTLIRQQETTQAEYNHLAQTHDPQRLATVESTYTQLRSTADRLEGGLPGKRQELERLTRELNQRAELAEKRHQAQVALEREKRVQQLIWDAREIYRQAGPRITQYYQKEISSEADRLFRELLNRPNVALEWTEDYDIRVQEEGHWRSFKSLSGGEQMCAALAVRLALLKVLSEIDVAFFDEPTTNMDQMRRRQLAETIANLRTFRQLFVISHDDTFEYITETIIRVERET